MFALLARIREVAAELSGVLDAAEDSPAWERAVPGVITLDVTLRGNPRTLAEWNARQLAIAERIARHFGTDAGCVLPVVAHEFPQHAPRAYAGADR